MKHFILYAVSVGQNKHFYMFSVTLVQNCGSGHDHPVVNFVVLLHVRVAEVVRKAASHGGTRTERWDFQIGWKPIFELRSSNGSVICNARLIDIINKLAHILDIFHHLPSVKETVFSKWSLFHHEAKRCNPLWSLRCAIPIVRLTF